MQRPKNFTGSCGALAKVTFKPIRARFANTTGHRKGNGADRVTRTPDPRITNAMLYQLSYVGTDQAPRTRRHGVAARSIAARALPEKPDFPGSVPAGAAEPDLYPLPLAPYGRGQAMGGKAGDHSRQVLGVRCSHRTWQVITPQLGEFAFGNIVIRQQADLSCGPG